MQMLTTTNFGVSFQALVPFSAMVSKEIAQLVTPPKFSEIESSSPSGLHWIATNVVVSNEYGAFKLYLCQRKGMAMWVPCGDWFTSNQLQTGAQPIGVFAERRSKVRARPKPYERPDQALYLRPLRRRSALLKVRRPQPRPDSAQEERSDAPLLRTAKRFWIAGRLKVMNDGWPSKLGRERPGKPQRRRPRIPSILQPNGRWRSSGIRLRCRRRSRLVPLRSCTSMKFLQ